MHSLSCAHLWLRAGGNQVSYYTIKFESHNPELSGETSFETDSESLAAAAHLIWMLESLRDGDKLTAEGTFF